MNFGSPLSSPERGPSEAPSVPSFADDNSSFTGLDATLEILEDASAAGAAAASVVSPLTQAVSLGSFYRSGTFRATAAASAAVTALAARRDADLAATTQRRDAALAAARLAEARALTAEAALQTARAAAAGAEEDAVAEIARWRSVVAKERRIAALVEKEGEARIALALDAFTAVTDLVREAATTCAGAGNATEANRALAKQVTALRFQLRVSKVIEMRAQQRRYAALNRDYNTLLAESSSTAQSSPRTGQPAASSTRRARAELGTSVGSEPSSSDAADAAGFLLSTAGNDSFGLQTADASAGASPREASPSASLQEAVLALREQLRTAEAATEAATTAREALVVTHAADLAATNARHAAETREALRVHQEAVRQLQAACDAAEVQSSLLTERLEASEEHARDLAAALRDAQRETLAASQQRPRSAASREHEELETETTEGTYFNRASASRVANDDFESESDATGAVHSALSARFAERPQTLEPPADAHTSRAATPETESEPMHGAGAGVWQRRFGAESEPLELGDGNDGGSRAASARSSTRHEQQSSPSLAREGHVAGGEPQRISGHGGSPRAPPGSPPLHTEASLSQIDELEQRCANLEAASRRHLAQLDAANARLAAAAANERTLERAISSMDYAAQAATEDAAERIEKLAGEVEAARAIAVAIDECRKHDIAAAVAVAIEAAEEVSRSCFAVVLVEHFAALVSFAARSLAATPTAAVGTSSSRSVTNESFYRQTRVALTPPALPLLPAGAAHSVDDLANHWLVSLEVGESRSAVLAGPPTRSAPQLLTPGAHDRRGTPERPEAQMQASTSPLTPSLAGDGSHPRSRSTSFLGGDDPNLMDSSADFVSKWQARARLAEAALAREREGRVHSAAASAAALKKLHSDVVARIVTEKAATAASEAECRRLRAELDAAKVALGEGEASNETAKATPEILSPKSKNDNDNDASTAARAASSTPPPPVVLADAVRALRASLRTAEAAHCDALAALSRERSAKDALGVQHAADVAAIASRHAAASDTLEHTLAAIEQDTTAAVAEAERTAAAQGLRAVAAEQRVRALEADVRAADGRAAELAARHATETRDASRVHQEQLRRVQVACDAAEAQATLLTERLKASEERGKKATSALHAAQSEALALAERSDAAERRAADADGRLALARTTAEALTAAAQRDAERAVAALEKRATKAEEHARAVEAVVVALRADAAAAAQRASVAESAAAAEGDERCRALAARVRAAEAAAEAADAARGDAEAALAREQRAKDAAVARLASDADAAAEAAAEAAAALAASVERCRACDADVARLRAEAEAAVADAARSDRRADAAERRARDAAAQRETADADAVALRDRVSQSERRATDAEARLAAAENAANADAERGAAELRSVSRRCDELTSALRAAEAAAEAASERHADATAALARERAASEAADARHAAEVEALQRRHAAAGGLLDRTLSTIEDETAAAVVHAEAQTARARTRAEGAERALRTATSVSLAAIEDSERSARGVIASLAGAVSLSVAAAGPALAAVWLGFAARLQRDAQRHRQSAVDALAECEGRHQSELGAARDTTARSSLVAAEAAARVSVAFRGALDVAAAISSALKEQMGDAARLKVRASMRAAAADRAARVGVASLEAADRRALEATAVAEREAADAGFVWDLLATLQRQASVEAALLRNALRIAQKENDLLRGSNLTAGCVPGVFPSSSSSSLGSIGAESESATPYFVARAETAARSAVRGVARPSLGDRFVLSRVESLELRSRSVLYDVCTAALAQQHAFVFRLLVVLASQQEERRAALVAVARQRGGALFGEGTPLPTGGTTVTVGGVGTVAAVPYASPWRRRLFS